MGALVELHNSAPRREPEQRSDMNGIMWVPPRLGFERQQWISQSLTYVNT